MSIPRDLASERTLSCVLVAAVPESSNEVAGDDSDTLITKYDFIDDFEFYHCIIITNLVIPRNITKICRFSFAGCRNLINVTIPNSVTEIGDNAFSKCSSLVNIQIPISVIKIGILPKW